MSLRIPMLITLSVLFAAPVVARSQTTDEVRVLAGKMLLPADEAPPVSSGTVAGTTDEVRARAGRMLRPATRAPVRVVHGVGSTDEARAAAGGFLVVAPAARHVAAASDGRS